MAIGRLENKILDRLQLVEDDRLKRERERSIVQARARQQRRSPIFFTPFVRSMMRGDIVFFLCFSGAGALHFLTSINFFVLWALLSIFWLVDWYKRHFGKRPRRYD